MTFIIGVTLVLLGLYYMGEYGAQLTEDPEDMKLNAADHQGMGIVVIGVLVVLWAVGSWVWS